MTNLDDLRDYIQSNLTRVLALGLVALSGMGVAIFAITNVLPAWKTHNELAAQVVSAQDSLQAQQDAGLSAADNMRTQAAAMQTKVAKQATVLLTEKEAAQVLSNLYGYARDAGAQITNLQAQPAPKTDTKAPSTVTAPLPYTIRVFRVTATGDPDALVSFLTRFREASLPGVGLSNLKTDDKTGATTLVMDVTMVTSPFAPGDALSSATGADAPPLPTLEGFFTPTPAGSDQAAAGAGQTVTPVASAAPSTPAPAGAGPTATAQPTLADQATATATAPTSTPNVTAVPAVQALLVQLDKEWAAENWAAIIDISQQILAIDPTTAGLSVKLYTAHTNYGYQLASQGKTDQAKAEFTAALAINPDGAAALAGLKMLTSPGPTPSAPVRIYVVQWGDTLANIAIHFNVSVQAIKAANHLTDDRIYAGQELIIPG